MPPGPGTGLDVWANATLTPPVTRALANKPAPISASVLFFIIVSNLYVELRLRQPALRQLEFGLADLTAREAPPQAFQRRLSIPAAV